MNIFKNLGSVSFSIKILKTPNMRRGRIIYNDGAKNLYLIINTGNKIIIGR